MSPPGLNRYRDFIAWIYSPAPDGSSLTLLVHDILLDCEPLILLVVFLRPDENTFAGLRISVHKDCFAIESAANKPAVGESFKVLHLSAGFIWKPAADYLRSISIAFSFDIEEQPPRNAMTNAVAVSFLMLKDIIFPIVF